VYKKRGGEGRRRREKEMKEGRGGEKGKVSIL
jgi:hypothetical protein